MLESKRGHLVKAQHRYGDTAESRRIVSPEEHAAYNCENINYQKQLYNDVGDGT
jgi:hypothetical protein